MVVSELGMRVFAVRRHYREPVTIGFVASRCSRTSVEINTGIPMASARIAIAIGSRSVGSL
jgi:hypothetical protein